MVQDDAGFDVSPIRKGVVVELGQEAAFQLFTQAMPSWWPVGSHSIGEARAREARFEGGVGVLETVAGQHADHVAGRRAAFGRSGDSA